MRKLHRLVLLCALGVISWFCLFYLAHDYASVAHWYLNINDCFYSSETWQQNFFTPNVKYAGDKWCVLALVICLLWAVALIRNRQSSQVVKREYKIPLGNVGWSLAIVFTGIALWSYSNLLLNPAYDEVFSAVNISSLPPFQSWSYYMLPNNHILFNLLNNQALVFISDRVVTGRVLSLFAYLGTLLLVFAWLWSVLKHRIFAFLIVLTIAVQLPTMGFGAQARGYEIELFSGWLAFTGLYKYIVSGDHRWLWWYAIATWVGYTVLPSFLYFHLGLLLFTFLWRGAKGASIPFLKYTIIALTCVFFFYLPALCFSGIESFTDNKYVTPAFSTFAQFWDDFPSRFTHYIGWGLSFIFEEENPLNYVLFLLPCLLLAARSRYDKMLGVFYMLQWIVFIAMVIVMQRFPFKRNLIIHYSISLCFLLYTIYLFAAFLAERFRLLPIRLIVFALLVFPVTAHLALGFKANAPSMLYGPDNNELYRENKKSVASLTTVNTIAFSEESFYWFYLYMKRGPHVQRCTMGGEQYFVKRSFEGLPPRYSQYHLCQKYFDDYELYKRPDNIH